jgi:Zn finger protein HypA/HybF involved in hydrogenase expression
MAMINCEECSEKISKKAKEFPKCGHPNKKANHLSAGQALGG